MVCGGWVGGGWWVVGGGGWWVVTADEEGSGTRDASPWQLDSAQPTYGPVCGGPWYVRLALLGTRTPLRLVYVLVPDQGA